MREVKNSFCRHVYENKTFEIWFTGFSAKKFAFEIYPLYSSLLVKKNTDKCRSKGMQAQMGISYPMHSTEIPILTSGSMYVSTI